MYVGTMHLSLMREDESIPGHANAEVIDNERQKLLGFEPHWMPSLFS